MSTNICFVSIFDLTRVYHEIAWRLQAAGHNIFWQTTNPTWTSWLINKGYPRERILELAYKREEMPNDSELRQLNSQIAYSEAMAGLTVSQSLLSDQFVMARSRDIGSQFAAVYYRDIRKFLSDNSIEVVIAEPTNLNELITFMLCKERDIKFYYPQTLRYPGMRFFLGEGMFDGKLAELPITENPESPCGRTVLDDFRGSRITPKYFELHNTRPLVNRSAVSQSLTSRLRKTISRERTHLTHHRLVNRLKLILRRSANSVILESFTRYTTLSQIDGRIAFFPLHVQPESSIDVYGSYVSDQLKLIKDIRRSLPFDMTLVVKEHPNFLGTKTLSFFNAVRKLPGVVLVHPKLSCYEIYDRASIVFSVSGTAAYEAALLGIPSITFCRMFFSGLSQTRYCSSVTDLRETIGSLLKSSTQDIEADSQFMQKLLDNSRPGYWSDPVTDIRVMDRQNIEHLARPFLELFGSSK